MAQSLSVDTSGWDEFWNQWKGMIEKIPGMKQAMLEAVGMQLTENVRRAIDASGVDDAMGRVKSWQNAHVGSGRGYVAVRPDSVEVPTGGGGRKTINAGALTHYLDDSHRVRQPSGRAKRYRPEASVTRTRDFRFYAKAGTDADRAAVSAADAFCKQILEELR